MVKKYFRTSLDSLIFQCVILIGLAIDTYFAFFGLKVAIVDGIIGEKGIGIFATIIYCIGIPLLVYLELIYLVGNIKLEGNKISVKSDFRFGRNKIQYFASIDYQDIVNVEIFSLNKNSLGKSISLSKPIPYLVLSNKNGKKVRFGLHLMSDKVVNKLLLNLREKCGKFNSAKFDVDEMMKSFKSTRLSAK